MKRALRATPLALREPAAISPAWRAQKPLVYEAWQATSGAQQALALWPDCLDAYVLAQLDSAVGNDKHGMLGAPVPRRALVRVSRRARLAAPPRRDG